MSKKILIGTLIYIIIIFPIRALWHVGIFQELYLGLGYFNQEETILAGIVGLLNIVLQGILLSILYGKTKFEGSPMIQGLKFSGIIGIFYFTLQVVNFVVRKEISNIPVFVGMEITYMIIQFSIYGILMGRYFSLKEF